MKPLEPFCYEYPRPAIATDAVVLSLDQGALRILLIQRNREPFVGRWALPGGFPEYVDETGRFETLEDCVERELREETGVANMQLMQFRAYSAQGRDPREAVVSMVFIATTAEPDLPLRADTDAQDARWVPIDEIATMAASDRIAFDHAEIIDDVRCHLARDADRLVFGLIEERFTLSELQGALQALVGKDVNKWTLRARLAKSKKQPTLQNPKTIQKRKKEKHSPDVVSLLDRIHIEQTAGTTVDRDKKVDHRPAQLYRCAQNPTL